MFVLGVSAGRRGKVTESLVKTVLEGTGLDTEFITLSGKLVRPCEACNGCVETNRCILRDDFEEVWERVAAADGLVFGAPTYWDRMNTKGATFWERLCFSGRHREVFPLRDKPAAMVAVDGSAGTGEYVLADLGRYFADARLDVVGHVAGGGEFACFTCGFGEDCEVGGFLSLYPRGTSIESERIPSLGNQCPHIDDGGAPARGEALRRSALELGAALARRILRRGEET